MHAERSFPRCLIALFSITLLFAPRAAADWNPGDAFKMHQPQLPDPEGWDICLIDQWLADDFVCIESGPIRDIHFWLSWQHDIVGEVTNQTFQVQIYSDAGGFPGVPLWSLTPGGANVSVRLYGSGPQGWFCPAFQMIVPNDHTSYYQVNITNILQPFEQLAGTSYWLVLRAQVLPPLDTAVGWKTSVSSPPQAIFGSPARWSTDLTNWPAIQTPAGTLLQHDMAFVITDTGGGPSDPREYGDAPEGAPAYPWLGVVGNFPTCVRVGPAQGFVRHNNFGAWFGWIPPYFDFEPDGNAGLCTLGPSFPPYDADECYKDNDAGLLIPEPYTIDAFGQAVPCPNYLGSALGVSCGQAQWGRDIDIHVHNAMPSGWTGYVNVLIDWDQNGVWGGSAMCPPAAPEHVLVDWPVPNGFDGPLSILMQPNPPSFLIGPNGGFVWARFTITEVQLTTAWIGSGDFEDGETEDYLLRVIGEPPEPIDWGDLPLPYATLAANNGPNHRIVPNFALGATIDGEPDGQPDPAAQGDDADLLFPPPLDDEDGVTFVTAVEPGKQSIIDVTNALSAGTLGFLEAWVDFGADGSFAEAGDQILVGVPLTPAPVNFDSFVVNIPAHAVPGPTYARFRLSSNPAGHGPVGPAPDGEVEDYAIEIIPPLVPKWTQRPHGPAMGFDAESDLGFIAPPDETKWQQLPNTSSSGFHAHDAMVGGNYSAIMLADQWVCLGQPVTKLVWYGNYELQPDGVTEKRFSGINYFNIEIDANGPPAPPLCLPNSMNPSLWSAQASFASVNETDTGLINSEGGKIYRYTYTMQQPFDQQIGQTYWLAVGAVSNNAGAAAIWRWQSNGPPIPNVCFAATRTLPTFPAWTTLQSELAFEIIQAGPVPLPEPNRVVADDFVSDGRAVMALRWWGSYLDDRYLPNEPVEPFIVDGWLLSFHPDQPDRSCPPDSTAGDNPSALAVYFAPANAVEVLPMGYRDCFNHDVFEYHVTLERCCLLCAESDPRDGRIPGSDGAFHEVRGFRYWLDIQAIVGLTWVDDDPTGCTPVFTGHLPPTNANSSFWGWHTSDGPTAPCGAMNGACAGSVTAPSSTIPPNDCPDYGPWATQPWLCPTAPQPVQMSFELLTREFAACATCPGDLDGNNVIDGRDIQGFVQCLINAAMPWSQCACADVNCSKTVTIDDIDEFVVLLLSGSHC